MPDRRPKYHGNSDGAVSDENSVKMKEIGSDVTLEVGFVVSAQDYLLYIEGLPSAKVNDIIVSENGSRAMVTALSKDRLEALMLDAERPAPGSSFSISNEGLNLPLSENLLGRAINPIGVPLDGKGGLPPGGKKLQLDVVAGGIHTRELIDEQLYTGMSKVDILLPLGKGQRELLFGEPKSGKGAFLRDIIVSQKTTGLVCIYVAIGQAEIDTKKFVENINASGAYKYTVIIAATSSESAPLISIAPSVAFSIAEFFRDKGREVLILLDDLGLHAKYLREIGLLGGKIPGRESYPADIFYQHSHMLERAGKYHTPNGVHTITAIPVIETDIESFSNLIPTNVMSITDGHLYFSSSLRAQGRYPAMDIGRSVTRVGRQTQKTISKELADKVRRLLADYKEMERYGRFGSELTEETQLLIKRGVTIDALLDQERGETIEIEVQLVLLCLVFTTFFDKKDVEYIKQNRAAMIKAIRSSPIMKSLTASMASLHFDELLKLLNDNLKSLESACPKPEIKTTPRK